MTFSLLLFRWRNYILWEQLTCPGPLAIYVLISLYMYIFNDILSTVLCDSITIYVAVAFFYCLARRKHISQQQEKWRKSCIFLSLFNHHHFLPLLHFVFSFSLLLITQSFFILLYFQQPPHSFTSSSGNMSVMRMWCGLVWLVL